MIVFLTGLFLVPIPLLWLGYKLRRRSRRAQRVFWGEFPRGHPCAW